MADKPDVHVHDLCLLQATVVQPCPGACCGWRLLTLHIPLLTAHDHPGRISAWADLAAHYRQA